MTISLSNSSPIQYAGNGSTVTYSFPWRIFSPTDLIVGFITGANYAQQSGGYTVSFSLVGEGGSVTFSTAPPFGTIVDLRPLTPETQPTQFANLSAYLPENTTNATDRITRMVQDLTRQSYTFGVHALDNESVAWPALPGPQSRAGLALIFDPVTGLPTLGQPTTTVVTQTLIAQLLYPQTAAESAAGVVPTSNLYPSGNVLRYGADNTGVASSWAAVNSAAAVCKISGLQMIIPPGDYLIDTVNGTITLEFVTVVGVAASNLYSPDSQGSVFNITGTVNTPFAVRRGASFIGVTFFYPNQVTDGVVPTVYPLTITDDASDNAVNNVYISKCKVVNAYRFFGSTSGQIGLLWITDNSIYGIVSCIEMTYNPDFVYIHDNSFSFDIFNTALLETNPSFRYTTRTSGTAIKIVRTDGMSIRGNGIFGYQYGINCPTTGGLIQQCQIVGNIFDQTLFGIAVSGAGNFTLNTVTGNMLTGYDNVTAQHSLIGNSINISTTGSTIETNVVSGNTFTAATGDHIAISGNTPARNYTISGNVFTAWGLFQASGTYNAVNSVGTNTDLHVVGNTIQATNNAGANQTGITATAAGVIVASNEFISCFNAVNISGAGLISGNRSTGTVDTAANKYTFPGSICELGNTWDKDGQISSGWGTPTNSSVQNNFGGSTATLAQTGAAVGALIVILKQKNILAP